MSPASNRRIAGVLLGVVLVSARPSAGQFVAPVPVQRWYRDAAMLQAAGYGGWGLGWGSGATTAAESYHRGMAELTRARGEAMESQARAARDYEVARQQYIENKTQWLEEYNQRKRIGLAEREAKNAERREAINRARAARASRPETPLAIQLDPETGVLDWPEVLRGAEYAGPRARLDELFQWQAQGASGAELADGIRQAAADMHTRLTAHIGDYAANDYIAADKFLKALQTFSG